MTAMIRSRQVWGKSPYELAVSGCTGVRSTITVAAVELRAPSLSALLVLDGAWADQAAMGTLVTVARDEDKR